MSERHWQSNDFCISKLVLQEGDMLKECGSFGATLLLEIEEDDLTEFFEKYPDESIFITNNAIKDSKLVIHVGMAVNDLDLSLEKTALSMFPGEKSRFDVNFKIQDQWITLHFVAFRQEDSSEMPPIFKWTNEQKFDLTEKFYNFGVELVQRKNYKGAFKLFKQSATLALFIIDTNDEKYMEKSKDLKLKCISNLTLCQQYLGQYQNMVHIIDYIFEKNNAESPLKNKAKLLSRKGHAQIKMKNYEEAINELNEALEIDPGNNTAKNDLNLAKKLKKKDELKMGNSLKKMFL